VLGNLLDVAGFEFNSSEEVRAETLGGQPGFVSGLDNGIDAGPLNLAASANGIERVADVPIHFADPLVRRSPALQQAADSAAPAARMNAAMLAKLGLVAGGAVKVVGAAAVTFRRNSMPACPMAWCVSRRRTPIRLRWVRCPAF